MRNLKKLLALVLALVMTMSLVAVANAADYKDVDADDDHAEAIDVMSAIGVIGGYPDGSFKPEGSLTRAEGAKIVAYMLLGDAVEDLPNSASSFADVPAGSWFAGPVAYLKGEGIVSGRSATIFDPDANLNGYEFAKMLLTALGYSSEKEGFTGASWTVNVATMASAAGINDDATMNSRAVTRGDAAQMAFNTLTADLVEYPNNTSVTAGDITVSISGKAEKVPSDENNSDYRTVEDDQDGIQQFCEKYFSDLKLTTGSSDDFGRPAEAWENDDGTIGKYGEKSVAVFTAATSAKDVASALKGYKLVDDSDNPYSVNNTTEYYTSKSGAQKDDFTTDAIVITDGNTDGAATMTVGTAAETIAKAISDETANGKLVEIYANSKKEITAIVEVRYVLEKVEDIKEKDGDVTYTLSVSRAKTDYAADSDDDDQIVINGTVAKDDYVTTATVGADNIVYVYPTTKVVGAQSAKTTDGVLTVGGTKYTVGNGVYTDAAKSSKKVDASTFSNSDNDANYYIDQYGFVVKTDSIAENYDYAVVDRIALKEGSGTAAAKQVEAVLVFPDATKKTVNVTKINGVKVDGKDTHGDFVQADEDGSNATIPTTPDGQTSAIKMSVDWTENGKITSMIVLYKETSDGYELTYLAEDNDDSTKDNDTQVLAKGVPTVHGENDFIGNNNTIYLVKTMSGEDEVFTAYTGYKNVPSIKTGKSTAAGDKVVVSGVKDDAAVAAKAVADFVYVDATGKNVDAGGSTTSKDVFYATTAEYTTYGSGSDAYYVYEGILNGAKTTIKSKDNTPVGTNADAAIEAEKLYELTVDENGYVTKAIEQTGSSTTYAKITFAAADSVGNGVLSDDSESKQYSYNDDTVVYVIDDGDVVDGGSVENADENDVLYIKVVDSTKDGQADGVTIDTIYIIKK